MLSKLSVKQMNLPESEKCDWKSCNITWTTANSKYDKTTHNPLARVWIIYLTVSTSINSRMNEKTHRIWLVATRVSNALWIAEKYKKKNNVIGVLWASKTTFPLAQTEETFHKLKWSCDISCTQHWPKFTEQPSNIQWDAFRDTLLSTKREIQAFVLEFNVGTSTQIYLSRCIHDFIHLCNISRVM